MVVQQGFQELDFQVAYNQVKSLDLSQVSGRAFLAVNNPGSYWVHFLDGIGTPWEWAWPTTFGWVMPLPLNHPAQLRVSTADVPTGYNVDSTNQTALATISVLSDFPRLSLGVQQLVSTKASVLAGLTVINVQAAPYNAKGDGVADDTAAIQSALNAVVAPGQIVYFPGGTYKITASLNVNLPCVMLGTDSGSIIKAAGNFSGLVIAYTASGTAVRWLTLQGNNVAGGYHGIDGGGVDASHLRNEILIERCTIYQWGGKGINVGGFCNRNRIVGCQIYSNLDEGILINYNSYDCYITDNVIHDNQNNGIDCNASRCLIARNNVFSNGLAASVPNNNGIVIAGVANGQTVQLNSVTDNIVDGNHGHGIYVTSAAGSSVQLNSIVGNRCYANGAGGTTGDGIICDGSSATQSVQVISGNTCHSNSRFGIYINASNSTVITGNLSASNTNDGIRIDGASTFGTVTGNVGNSNGGWGLNIVAAAVNGQRVGLNTLIGNTTGAFQDNGTGTVKTAQG